MIRLLPRFLQSPKAGLRSIARSAAFLLVFPAFQSFGQSPPPPQHFWFVDCAASLAGDGSRAHPWSTLAEAQKHSFVPGDEIAFARGTTCHGSFSPLGSGTPDKPIRLTAWGQGPRPRIVAGASDRQALLLFNQEYWQVDSLDISGGNTYGIFVSGDKGTLHHIYLKNLSVHDVHGGAMKSKDNGLVVISPSAHDVTFDDVLVDGVTAAHTTQWAGILIGGGNFGMDMPLNNHVTVRNSSAHDVYGDGIVLFRDSDGLIENSSAWETGMQPTQTIGTPNAIWTWTCTNCTVRDNEAFLTDSPGVDGGAYDIDWNNVANIVERNYAHDTQGYCIAVFAAGYVTRDSIVRNNLCMNNALSPRLAALQGAVYLHTWNDGIIRSLNIEHNTIIWNPPVASAAAIVDDASTGDAPISFTGNRIESSASQFYLANAQFAPSANSYSYTGKSDAHFTLGGTVGATFAALQSAGFEKGSTLENNPPMQPTEIRLRLDATVPFTLDSDGLLAPATLAQITVLRSLADQYSSGALAITVHLCDPEKTSPEQATALSNSLLDLNAGHIHFVHDGKTAGLIRLITNDGRLLEEWHGFQNAATLDGTVRARLGPPHFASMKSSPLEEQ